MCTVCRMGKYKLIDGNPGNNRDWFPPYLSEKYEDMQNPKVDRNVTLLFDLNSKYNHYCSN